MKPTVVDHFLLRGLVFVAIENPLQRVRHLRRGSFACGIELRESSACCTRASRVPILNEGIGNGKVSPLSRPTVAASAVMGSSSKILSGSETRRYWVGCMIGYWSMP